MVIKMLHSKNCWAPLLEESGAALFTVNSWVEKFKGTETCEFVLTGLGTLLMTSFKIVIYVLQSPIHTMQKF